MRRAIARARLCTRLKTRDVLKKAHLFWLKKPQAAADGTSKTTTFFIFHFYITQRSYEKIMCIYLLFDWFSGENCITFTFFYTKDDRLRQIKKKHEWCNNRFSDVFCLNLKHFASLFFLTEDNFILWIKSLFFSFNFRLVLVGFSICAGMSGLLETIKLQAGLQLYEKGDSGAGVFLWILQKFLEHLFLQNTSGGCFCLLIAPFHCVISNFEKKCSIVNKKPFLPKFSEL